MDTGLQQNGQIKSRKVGAMPDWFTRNPQGKPYISIICNISMPNSQFSQDALVSKYSITITKCIGARQAMRLCLAPGRLYFLHTAIVMY
jgi:hypothetical protein